MYTYTNHAKNLDGNLAALDAWLDSQEPGPVEARAEEIASEPENVLAECDAETLSDLILDALDTGTIAPLTRFIEEQSLETAELEAERNESVETDYRSEARWND